MTELLGVGLYRELGSREVCRRVWSSAVVPREVVGSQPDTREEEQPPSKGTSCLPSGVMVSTHCVPVMPL